MSSSKRRSYLGLGVSNFNFNTSTDRLGTIDAVCRLGSDNIPYNDLWKMQCRAKFMLSMRSIEDFPKLIEQLDKRKEWNRVSRKVETLLDLFPSLKYSYSSQLPGAYKKGIVDVRCSSETGKTYVGDIARSHSIRLDPVDSPKELKKYRLRIQRVIDWSYKVGLVPVMMTLTMFHRWDNLAPLCRALRLAWSSLFGTGQAGYERKLHIGLQGYIRRMEETLNDGSEFEVGNNGNLLVPSSLGNVLDEVGSCGLGSVAAARNDLSNVPQSDAISLTNAGWHPHYHVILLIPRDKVQVLSDYEETLKDVWLNLVCKYYKQEVGKEVPVAYYNAFKEHGLVLSRYKSESHAKRCGNRHGKSGDLLEVHDGKYLAKMLGYDSPEVFGGDSEMTSFNSKSNFKCDANGIPHIGGKIPFDLLCEELTASNVDLWCEYAIATKGIPCFTFTKGLEKTVAEYYKEHPEEEYVKMSFSTNSSNAVTVGSLSRDDYKKLYRSFQVGNMLKIAKYGVDKLSEWLKDNFDIDIFKPATEKKSSSVKGEDKKSETHLLSVAPEIKENIQVNEEDLAVAEKMEKDVYMTYHVHLLPLVSNGLSIEDAIHSFNISDSQKDLLFSLVIYYRDNIRKSKERLENLNSGDGNNSISSPPPPDIQDSLPIRAVKAPCFSYGDETAQFFIAFYKKIELY